MRLSELVDFAKDQGYDDPELDVQLCLSGGPFYDPLNSLTVYPDLKVVGGGSSSLGSVIDIQLVFKGVNMDENTSS